MDDKGRSDLSSESTEVLPPTPGTAQIAKPKSLKGTSSTLMKFEIINLLGKGAFGQVYKVKHKVTGRIMALKHMSKELIQNTNKCEHIKNEKLVLQIAALYAKSPYLIKLHYSFQDEASLYLAMEYCPGGDLLALIEAINYFSEEEGKLFFAEMIMAVNSLHSLGFLHRDLKPDNFLIDVRGHIKLADFGLSKQGLKKEVGKWKDYKKRRDRLSLLPTDKDQKVGSPNNPTLRNSAMLNEFIQKKKPHTPLARKGWAPNANPNANNGGNNPLPHHFEAHSIVGTPPYMSPEMIPDQGDHQLKQGYGKEVDWWSLGCVFYEMLSGSYPFVGTGDEIFDSIRNYSYQLPHCLARLREFNLSEDIINLVAGFLQDSKTRLGKDIKKVQQHDFFKNFDWENLEKMNPPPEILWVLNNLHQEMNLNWDTDTKSTPEPTTTDPTQEPSPVPETVPEDTEPVISQDPPPVSVPSPTQEPPPLEPPPSVDQDPGEPPVPVGTPLVSDTPPPLEEKEKS